MAISVVEEGHAIESHAVAIAAKAGEILLSHFGQPVDVEFKGKGKRDPVTAADRHSDDYLRAAIQERFPEHNVLSEEGRASASGSPFTWVLDPLDGTVNFMNGLPLFAVSVGVLWNRQPVVGSVWVPVSHKASAGVYHARLGNGAWLDSERIDIGRSPSGRLLAAMPGSRSFRLTGQSRKEPHEDRGTGSMAVELAFAACGIFRYAVFGRPRIWDVAAGVLLVKEAGGAALVRQKGGWHSLDRFEPRPGKKRAEPLGSWSSPLVVGAAEAVTRVVRDIRGPAFHLGVPTWLGGHKRSWPDASAGQAPRGTG